MEVVLRSTIFFVLFVIMAVVADTKIPAGTTKLSPPSGQTGFGTGFKASSAEPQPDLSRLSLAELVAQAKDDVKRTHDELEAARGVNLVKNLADESNQKLDQTCLRALGQALLNVTKSAEKTQKAAQFKAKEIEKRLANEKKSVGPAPTLPPTKKFSL